MHTGVCGSTGSGHPGGEAEPRSCCRAGWKTPGRGSGGGQEHRPPSAQGARDAGLGAETSPCLDWSRRSRGSPQLGSAPAAAAGSWGLGRHLWGVRPCPDPFPWGHRRVPRAHGTPGRIPASTCSQRHRPLHPHEPSPPRLPDNRRKQRAAPSHTAPSPPHHPHARGTLPRGTGTLQGPPSPPQPPRSAVPLTPMGATHALPARVPIPFPSLDRYK